MKFFFWQCTQLLFHMFIFHIFYVFHEEIWREQTHCTQQAYKSFVCSSKNLKYFKHTIFDLLFVVFSWKKKIKKQKSERKKFKFCQVLQQFAKVRNKIFLLNPFSAATYRISIYFKFHTIPNVYSYIWMKYACDTICIHICFAFRMSIITCVRHIWLW